MIFLGNITVQRKWQLVNFYVSENYFFEVGGMLKRQVFGGIYDDV